MKTIAIDFDGVIHKYSKGWDDGTCYDEPVEGAEEFLHHLLAHEYCVFIFSTRSPYQIEDWMIKHMPAIKVMGISIMKTFWDIPGIVGITTRKLPAIAYIDDRGIPFTGSFTGLKEKVLNFKTYQEQ